MFCAKSGCKLSATGQVLAAFSNIVISFFVNFPLMSNTMSMALIFRGDALIVFTTESSQCSKFIPCFSAAMPIMVSAQLPKAVATKSVGEKFAPLPLLSTGASVTN